MEELSKGAWVTKGTVERDYSNPAHSPPPPPLQHPSLPLCVCVCVLGSRSFRNGRKIEGVYCCQSFTECVCVCKWRHAYVVCGSAMDRCFVCNGREGVLTITRVEDFLSSWNTNTTSLLSFIVLSIVIIRWFNATRTTVEPCYFWRHFLFFFYWLDYRNESLFFSSDSVAER